MRAFLKYIPFLAKFGSLGSWFAPLLGFLPGGQIGLIITKIIDFIAKVIGWIVEDVVDLLSKPKRFALAIVLVATGAWLAADHYRDKMNELRKELADETEAKLVAQGENQDWRKRYADQTERAKAAEKARTDAEETARHEINAAEDKARRDAARAAAKRLRPVPAPAPAVPSAAPATAGPGVPSWGPANIFR